MDKIAAPNGSQDLFFIKSDLIRRKSIDSPEDKKTGFRKMGNPVFKKFLVLTNN